MEIRTSKAKISLKGPTLLLIFWKELDIFIFSRSLCAKCVILAKRGWILETNFNSVMVVTNLTLILRSCIKSDSPFESYCAPHSERRTPLIGSKNILKLIWFKETYCLQNVNSMRHVFGDIKWQIPSLSDTNDIIIKIPSIGRCFQVRIGKPGPISLFSCKVEIVGTA